MRAVCRVRRAFDQRTLLPLRTHFFSTFTASSANLEARRNPPKICCTRVAARLTHLPGHLLCFPSRLAHMLACHSAGVALQVSSCKLVLDGLGQSRLLSLMSFVLLIAPTQAQDMFIELLQQTQKYS